MGFDDSETRNMYQCVAGIMHMGEMKFKQRPREEQAEPDGEEGHLCYSYDHYCSLIDYFFPNPTLSPTKYFDSKFCSKKLQRLIK